MAELEILICMKRARGQYQSESTGNLWKVKRARGRVPIFEEKIGWKDRQGQAAGKRDVILPRKPLRGFLKGRKWSVPRFVAFKKRS
jgi:hypothetical protein